MLSKFKKWLYSSYEEEGEEAKEAKEAEEKKRPYSKDEIKHIHDEWRKKLERKKIADAELLSIQETWHKIVFEICASLDTTCCGYHKSFVIANICGQTYKIVFSYIGIHYGRLISSIEPIKTVECSETNSES